jgi:hypoxanthine phosphoribosyltransferase
MSGEEKVVQLYSSEQVHKRLDELARFVNEDYREREILLIGVLNGARVVTEELARRLRVPFVIDYVKAESYGQGMKSSGRVHVDFRLRECVTGRHVLLVDDIVDGGHTLAAVRERVRAEGPKSLRTFVLANKPLHRKLHVPLDYVAFTMPNKFLVGFGAGLGEKYRDLPHLGYIAQA